MKKIVSLSFLAYSLFLLIVASGCSLCCAPYDYCGPVFADGRCANLARQRCGTAFNQNCSTNPQEVIYDENGQPVSVPPQGAGQTLTPAPEIQPSVQPGIQPTPGSSSPAGPTVSPTAFQGQPMMGSTSAQPQYRQASAPQMNFQPSSQSAATALPVMTADASNATALSAAMPQNGTIAVNADGYQKVAVYDENQQLLGYEIIDASGKSVQQLPAPQNVQ